MKKTLKNLLLGIVVALFIINIWQEVPSATNILHFERMMRLDLRLLEFFLSFFWLANLAFETFDRRLAFIALAGFLYLTSLFHLHLFVMTVSHVFSFVILCYIQSTVGEVDRPIKKN
jgi:hypothetical protein